MVVGVVKSEDVEQCGTGGSAGGRERGQRNSIVPRV